MNKTLRELFFQEQGIPAINCQDEPDIDYVDWLEKKVLYIASPKEPCSICGTDRVWKNILVCPACSPDDISQ